MAELVTETSSVPLRLTERIRLDSSFVASISADVKIDQDAIKAFVSGITIDEWNRFSHGEPTAPEDITSLDDAIQYWCYLDMMNFGSGFRRELHAATGLGAYESMRRAVHNLLRRGGLSLQPPSETVVAECLGANIRLLVGHIHRSLVESAEALAKLGATSMAQWVCKRLTELKSQSQTGKVSAVLFSEELVQAFKPFRDISLYKGREILLAKKAQLLCADLHRQLKEKDSIFEFDEIESLTVFSDNVLPAVLGHFGILRFSEKLSAHLASGNPLPAGDEEVELRACAIHACELIVQEARHTATQVPIKNCCDLDFYLWMKGARWLALVRLQIRRAA